MVKKVGRKWVLYTKDGSKVLGKHDSRQDAIRQEVAIDISKSKKEK